MVSHKHIRLALTLMVLAGLVKPASAQVPTFDFVTQGVQSAKVSMQGGVPTLLINGQAVPPLFFLYQGIRSNPTLYWTPEAQAAASHGIHLYSIWLTNFPWDHGKNGPPMNYAAVDSRIQMFLQADPQAVFLLQLIVEPGPEWAPSPAPTTADQLTKYDGSIPYPGYPSIASDIYFNGFLTSAQQLVQHLEASALASHILGYKINGQNSGEWFPNGYRENGPDYSASNTGGFRAWLTAHYGSDANLSQAWGKAVSLKTALIPLIDPSRLPLEKVPAAGSPLISFYPTPAEQDWIDYSQYTSDLCSQRVLDIAQMFRTATQGKKIISFYNGYTFELAGSFNGHLRLDRLLASPNIDFISSPISYSDRVGGGPAGAMSARDSIAAHGKIQMAEDDLRTYLGAASGLPDLANTGDATTSGFDETLGVLRRNFAAEMIHRSGTWWMDLNENGAFNEPKLWDVMSSGLALYNNLLGAPKPYRPEVALVVDPASIAYEKDHYQLNFGTRQQLRNALGRTGTAFGVYLLDDFLSGVLPPCKVYIFANLWYLTDNQITAIQNRLNAEGSVAIWQYAPGYLGGANGPDESRISRLTGITVKRVDGLGSSSGLGVLSGFGWGYYRPSTISPRLTVNDTAATIIGKYQSDGLASAARKKAANFTSYYFAEWSLYDTDPVSHASLGDLLRVILRSSGVHIWTDNNEIVHTDGSLLAIHTLPAGTIHVHLPTGVAAVPLESETVTSNGDGIDVKFNQYETHFFSLKPAPPTVANLSSDTAGGSTQLLSVTFNVPNGYQNLDVANILINTALNGIQACYLAYSRPSNALYIVADNGDATQLSGKAMDGTGTVGNSQCTVTLAGSSAKGNGNTLTLVLNMSYSASFAGNKVIYAAARDLVANNSGWQTIGVHSVPPFALTFPNPVSMNPPFGNSLTQTITFTYQDEAAATNLQTVWALINTALDGRAACYVAYYRPGNQLYLYPDNGDGTQAANMVLTGNNTISNSQCIVSAQGANVQTDGKTLTVSLPITFSTAFAGFKGVWMAATTIGNAQTSQWEALGVEAVPRQ